LGTCKDPIILYPGKREVKADVKSSLGVNGEYVTATSARASGGRHVEDAPSTCSPPFRA